MKLTSKIVSVLAICLAFIFIAKLIYWIISDIPISNGSMFILALFILFLSIRNRFTYFFLGGLAIFCLAYHTIYKDWSGYLIVDFMASFRKPMGSINRVLLNIPFAVYVLTLFLLLLPTTRKLYFKSTSHKMIEKK